MSEVQLEFSFEELCQLGDTLTGAGLIIGGVLRGDALARIQLLNSVHSIESSLGVLLRLRNAYTLAAMNTTNVRAN